MLEEDSETWLNEINKFIEIENLTESNLNYIQITSGDTCHSEIGMLGGKQYLLL